MPEPTVTESPEYVVIVHHRFWDDREHVLDDECWCDPLVLDVGDFPFAWSAA